MEDNSIKIAILQTKMDNIEKKVDDGFHEIKLLVNNHMNTVEEHMKSISEEKANKWVEKFVIGVSTIVGIAFMGGLIKLVFLS